MDKQTSTVMSRETFADKNPDAYKMLLEFFRVPPRRTLVNLADGKVEIFCQPMEETENTQLHEFPFTVNKVREALVFLEKRRVCAGFCFDGLETSPEERERRQAELEASREAAEAGDERSFGNVIALRRPEDSADAQVAAL